MRKLRGWRELGALCLSLMFGALGGCDEQPPVDAISVAGAPDVREGELCLANADCGSGEFCETSAGACGREGVCTALPEVCDSTRAPVCGCDGRDYRNPCQAAQASQSVNNTGSCAPPPCYSNADCVATSYCAKAIGDCAGAGTCKARPTLCSGLFKPVCGCNNATYANTCKANSVGQSLFKTGAC